jgi:2,3-bisphosphoglycerate-dependent phosphoglycerate mutase
VAQSTNPTWPSQLLLVRHGESAGNIARDLAESQGHPFIDIAQRDMDVELSVRGQEQAAALRPWLRRDDFTPDFVLASPYVRAEGTALIATEGLGRAIVLDERLREREFGMLDRLTRRGIEERFPEQASARARLGKFYHRPPGGESWCDVGLRVRSSLDTISRQYAGQRVVVVSHEVVILMFCFVLQHLREKEVLELAKAHPLANCSVTRFVAGPDDTEMTLEKFGDTEAVDISAATKTNESDRAVAPR